MSVFLITVGFIMMMQLLDKRDAAYIKAAPKRKVGHTNYGIGHIDYGNGKGLRPGYSNASLKKRANGHDKYGKDHCYGKSVEHNPCKSLNCLNGGTCTTNSEGIASCICAEGFFGLDCMINPCESITCFNGGTCSTNSSGIANCICVKGFFGQDCVRECPTPGYLYVPEIDFCIKFYIDRQTKDDAQSRCAAENANIVVPDTLQKDMFYTNYILNKTVGSTGFWIGAMWLSGINSASIWQWQSGQLLQNTYQHWWPDEPATNGYEACAVSYYNEYNGWYATRCDSSWPSFCEQNRI